MHNIKLAIYKDIHRERERANTCVFGLYLIDIEISLQ